MKIVFAGTPEFAAQAMRAIYDAGHEIVLALTQPDRRAGRGMHLQASPVKEFALKKNITVLSGTFDDKIGEALKMLPVPDLLFFDGNHRLEATLRYWEKCLPSLHAGSVAVFDDIHWSPEMEEAWRLIIARPEVKVSIDLYHLGVIYFREELSKEDFVLRF